MKRLVLATALTVAALAFGSRAAAPPERNAPILILYAFDEEGKTLASGMQIEDTARLLGRPVLTGMLGGQRVVLSETGIGMTNAAMSAQILIDRFRPRAVVLSGIAGAIDTIVRVGDIVVAKRWIDHDYGYVGKNGFEPGGIRVYQPERDSIVKTASFAADSLMLVAVRRLPRDSLRFTLIGSRKPSLLVGGTGVSGNTFIDSAEKRQWLKKTFDAQITDMESAAVAQVCTANDIPFIIFRSASDLAGGSGSETAHAELDQFFRVAAANSAAVVLMLLSRL